MNTASEGIRKVSGIGKGGTGMWMAMLLLCLMAVLIPKSGWSLDPIQERDAFISSLPKGDTFDNDGATYTWLPTLGAEKSTGTANAAETAALQAASANGAFVEQKGPFLIYKQSPATEAAVAGSSSSESIQTYPVVLNTRTHSIGILTGRLFLELKDMQNAETIARDYHLTLSFINAAMSTAFYEIPSGTTVNLLTLRKRLQSDDRIQTVTLDMMDHINSPR